jgi:HSP20 family protein
MDRDHIRNLRARLDLSQERFARCLGVSLQTVRRWEAGLTTPLPIIGVKLQELERETFETKQQTGGGQMTDDRKTVHDGPVDIGLGGVFKGIGGLLDLVSKMSEAGDNEYSKFGETESPDGKMKGVYGLSVKLGLGGKPIIEQFGNIKATEKGTQVAESREPLVDIFDEGSHIVVVAELPGVASEDIKLEVEGDILRVEAEAKARKYAKEVLLPSAVEARSMESTYQNGILEIRLSKR